MMRNIVQVFLLVTLIAGCASNPQDGSPVEVREFQTRDYQDTPPLVAYKAVINALLDDGFTLESSDAQSGVIVGSFDSTHVSASNVAQKAAMTVLTYGLNWLYTDRNVNYRRTLHVTANITDMGDATRVRLYYSGKEYNTKGNLVRSAQNKDKEYYHSVFTRIEKSIFLEENL